MSHGEMLWDVEDHNTNGRVRKNFVGVFCSGKEPHMDGSGMVK